MQICLLGPLEVRADSGTPVEVGGARLRRLLILLALEPGRTVSVRRLVDGVWDGEPPSGEANALQALVSRLRRAVPGLPVEARPGGYRLDVPPDDVDLHRFEAEVAAGRARLAGDPAVGCRRLADALALWRGPVLADVADADFARAPVARATELRLTATEDLIEARVVARRSIAPQWRAMITAGLGHVATGLGDLPAAREHLGLALDLAVESMDAPVVAIVVVAYAGHALRAGRPTDAARLLGGADGVRGGDDRSALDALRVARAARAAFGGTEFAEAYAGGRDTRLDSVRGRITLDA